MMKSFLTERMFCYAALLIETQLFWNMNTLNWGRQTQYSSRLRSPEKCKAVTSVLEATPLSFPVTATKRR